ncbi:MAG TPA: DNA adenine methylase [Chromatiaceae bacterium]|nr:DNA adenine methylase [Chromatiaceae bacterium]
MPYPGGKGASGVYQRLINQIPPHRVYIETHLGSGAIMRHKRPAKVNLGLDVDPEVLVRWKEHPHARVEQRDAEAFLADYPFEGDEFVYVDPPYLRATRRSGRPIYAFEYTREQHESLLDILVELPCYVMVSGYWSELYATRLESWRTMTYAVRTRSGATAQEWVWMNYVEPETLHDYRYLGENFRERERIRRRIARWKSRLESLSPLERKALLAAIQ